MCKRFLTFITAVLVSTAALMAQRSHWYSGELLTNNQIQCIVEDSKGFIWIGTEYGLNKFDGYQFSPYFHDESRPGSLANNYVRCMRNAPDGKIWVGTGGGLQLMNPDSGEFLTVAMPSGRKPYINQIEISSNGGIWFLASGSGVCRVTDDKTYVAESVDFISRMTGTSNLTCIKEDSRGILWVGTGNGIYQCNPSSQSVVRFASDIIDSHITGVCESRDGYIFISTNSRVYKWDRNADSLTELSMRHSSRIITHLFMDGDGVLYVALRGDGLRWYNVEQDRLVRYDDKSREPGLLRMDVSAFYTDSNGNLWLGCYLNGVMLIKNGQTQFKSWRFQDYVSFPGGSVTTMAIDGDGNLWCGFLDNPVICFDSNGRIAAQLQDQPYASCLFLSGSGRMWAGLYNGDIALLNTSENVLEIKSLDGDNAAIISIAEDASGNLYYATRGTGFGMYNPRTGGNTHWSGTSYSSEGSSRPDNDWINALSADSDGMLWIGHNTGVSCFDTRTAQFVPAPQYDGISGNTCNVILCDRTGKVWIGTGDGLTIYDKKTDTCVSLTSADGLSNNSISGLLQDADGNIWCSTRVGLNRIDCETLKIDRFYSGYGLLDKSYNTRACVSDKSGRMLFWGSRQGITYFVPSDITGQDNFGDVVLTGFYLNDTPAGPETMSGRRVVMKAPVSVSEEFHLSYKDNSFTLEFSTFDYGNQDCITYEYSFNHNQWNSTPAGVNRITFTRMSPGRHQLNVRAISNNNVSETSTYTIYIASPWYLSVWAIIVYVFCALCVVMILAYNNKQRHIRELGEVKLQSFTNVAHELCSPLTMMISPLDELLRSDSIDDASRRSLRMMHRASTKMLNLVNQLLDIRRYDEGQMHLKCKETDLVSFVQGVYEMFMYSAGQHNIRYSFSHSQDELLVWIDRDSIEKIISNLLSNAFKYTPDGGEVRIELRSGTDDTTDGPLHHYAEVVVTDSGIGLNVADVNNVFERFYRADNALTSVTLGLGIGLNYSRILVEMHHGAIMAKNRDDSQGSQFWFRLPLGNSHLREDEMDMSVPASYVIGECECADVTEPAAHNTSAASGYKVLVADDDESILDYIGQSLRASYYKVIVCRNGKEGLRLAISQMPDVIISDVVMPEMDGIGFVRALRNNPNVSHIPVILLSARNQLQDRMNGMETGADVYLPKPFYLNELKIQVANLINNRLIVRGKFSGEQEQKDRLETPELQSNDGQLMDRIMDVINRNMSNPELSVEMLAGLVGVSRTQLHRKLKNMTGLSAGRFIYNIRIRHAATLLEQGGVNISEIADMSGFNTAAHFATAFKNYYGMTPSEYIKSRAGKTGTDV